MTVEEIKVDLFDEDKEGNKRIANLVDEGRWQQLLSQYADGRGEFTIEQLLEELIEGP
jgi:hypothetical protein